MEYVEVKSSQIAEVGFGEGYYGPETLALRFPPTKKQVAAGEDGSEYHYQNVTPRMHQALMAAPSIGSYFGQNIKSRPDLYPFMKVEADPTEPPSSPNGGGATLLTSTAKQPTCTDVNHAQSVGVSSGASSTTNRGSSNVTDAEAKRLPLTHGEANSDTPAPVTSLAVIDTLENSALFASGGVTDAQLALGREWYLANAPKGIETEEKRTALKRFARPLQKLRTGIEARAKEFTGETKRKLAAIDTEKRRLVGIVGGIEDEVLAPLTSWEAEEAARKIRLAGICNELAAKGQRIYMDMAEIEAAIAELEAFDLSTMQEYKIGAESAIIASLKVLKPELERRKESEAQAAELAKLRAEAAERAEQDRLASIAKGAQEAAIEAERKRVADAAKAEYAAMEARAADEQHRKQVHADIYDALLEFSGSDDVERIVGALIEGLIPHIKINY